MEDAKSKLIVWFVIKCWYLYPRLAGCGLSRIFEAWAGRASSAGISASNDNLFWRDDDLFQSWTCDGSFSVPLFEIIIFCGIKRSGDLFAFLLRFK